MDPKWHPLALMVIGGVILLVTYFSSLFFVQTTLSAVIAFTVLTIAALTLASGITLAFIHTYRKEAPRVTAWRRQ